VIVPETTSASVGARANQPASRQPAHQAPRPAAECQAEAQRAEVSPEPRPHRVRAAKGARPASVVTSTGGSRVRPAARAQFKATGAECEAQCLPTHCDLPPTAMCACSTSHFSPISSSCERRPGDNRAEPSEELGLGTRSSHRALGHSQFCARRDGLPVRAEDARGRGRTCRWPQPSVPGCSLLLTLRPLPGHLGFSTAPHPAWHSALRLLHRSRGREEQTAPPEPAQ
jgi:hypothetical protein